MKNVGVNDLPKYDLVEITKILEKQTKVLKKAGDICSDDLLDALSESENTIKANLQGSYADKPYKYLVFRTRLVNLIFMVKGIKEEEAKFLNLTIDQDKESRLLTSIINCRNLLCQKVESQGK